MYTYFDQKFISKSWCISSLELIISPMEVALSFESLLKSEFKIWAFIHCKLNLRYFSEKTSTSLESSLRANLHDDSCTSFFNRGFENKLDSWNMNSESIFREPYDFSKSWMFSLFWRSFRHGVTDIVSLSSPCQQHHCGPNAHVTDHVALKILNGLIEFNVVLFYCYRSISHAMRNSQIKTQLKNCI